MMILAKLHLNGSRRAKLWSSNPYRVHQRLRLAFPEDPRLLFRIDEPAPGARGRYPSILVQASSEPDWEAAFADFDVLRDAPAWKSVDPPIERGSYRFLLLANPIVCREGKRLGLLREEDQRAWIQRKLRDAGRHLMGVRLDDLGLRSSKKGSGRTMRHLAVRFEGMLECEDPGDLQHALEAGIGPAKGLGFGLLSLAPAR